MEKLVLLEYGRALVQGQLDQLVVEHTKLRKDWLRVVPGIFHFFTKDLELLTGGLFPETFESGNCRNLPIKM